jgi:hypothetical protein
MWEYLEVMRYVEMRGENGKVFRIKGCIHNFSAEADDKQTVLRELQSLTLLLWDGGERVVDHKTDGAQLAEWIPPLLVQK